jgi:hypothetical protein
MNVMKKSQQWEEIERKKMLYEEAIQSLKGLPKTFLHDEDAMKHLIAYQSGMKICIDLLRGFAGDMQTLEGSDGVTPVLFAHNFLETMNKIFDLELSPHEERERYSELWDMFYCKFINMLPHDIA